MIVIYQLFTKELISGYSHFREHCTAQGPRRVKKSGGSNTPMASAGAREREPIMGVWGRSPQRGSRGRAPGGGSGGRSPSAADEVYVFKTVIFNVSATVLHEMMYCLSCFFCKVSK